MPRIPFELAPMDGEPRSPVGYRPARRSLIVLMLVTGGYLVSRRVEIPASVWLSCAGLFAAVGLVTRGWACRVLLMLSVAGFAGGWFAWSIHETMHAMDRDAIAVGGGARYEEPLWLHPMLVRAEGIVVESVRTITPATGSLSEFDRAGPSVGFTVHLESLSGPGGTTESGWRVRVTVPVSDSARAAAVRAGDRVRLSGHLWLNSPALNPGEPDRRMLNADRNVIGRIRLPSDDLIERMEAGSSGTRVEASVRRVVGAVQDRARRSLEALIGPEPRGHDENGADDARTGRALLAAMLMGEREPGYEEADRAFRRLGLVHLVAISGFNLAVLASLALFLVRLTGDRGKLEPLIAAGTVTLYMLVVPAEAPILRAGITLLVFLITESLGARYDRLTLLGWTAIGLLLWHPMDLWSLGFQLSFGIVAALLWLGDRTTGRMFGVPLRGTVEVRRSGWRAGRRAAVAWCGRWVRSAIASSALAWCVAMPVVAHHTGIVSPMAVMSTLVVLPLTIVLLWVGYIALAIGIAWPGAGGALGEAARFMSEVVSKLVTTIDDVPGMSVTMPSVSAMWTVVATVCVVAWFRWWRVRHWAPIAATALVGAWLGAEAFRNTRLPGDVRLRLDTIAVGDATCHLVRSGNEAVLWDCGASSSAFGRTLLPRIVRELGAGRVRTAVVTHANLDHFSALADAAPALGIERVMVCGPFIDAARRRPESATGRLMALLESEGVHVTSVHAGDAIPFNLGELRFISPRADDTGENVNDTSLVAQITVPTEGGERRVMLTGDIGPAGLRAMQARCPALAADVLEVPHHGSFNHEASALVFAVAPSVVVQSTGRQRVNDPRWAPARAGRTWHCTATDGLITTEILGDGAVVSWTWLEGERGGVSAGRIP